MNWTLHHGDALAVLPTLTAATMDCVITDPPYNSGGRTSRERSTQSARGKYVSTGAHHDLADFAGDNRDQRSFIAWLALILSECLRSATPGASALVFCDWRQLPATSDAMQAAGWTWRGVVPWRKTISRPLRDGFRRECEYILWGSNGPPVRHADPIYLPGFLHGAQPRGRQRRHITQKPVEILRELVRICPPGGTVLDPFAGAGSTGIAAMAEGRRFVGIEVTGHYAGVAEERLRSTTA
ncbi:site-specific DNA-methyltransferase [Spirillospora sp. NBC_00431]